jgi:hypothetical protein
MTGKEVANFRSIKALGIPYSRTHIWRLERFPERLNRGFP